MLPIQIEADKGYILMHEIDSQKDISQRELSKKTGLSLGTVNLLLQKMIKQGHIKMENIPTNRVIYMLTPEGMAEKAIKTIRYIRNHYRIIQDTISKLQDKLDQFHQQYDVILICKPDNELASLLQTAVDEYLDKHPNRIVQIIEKSQTLKSDKIINKDNAILLFLPDEVINDEMRSCSLSSFPKARILDAE